MSEDNNLNINVEQILAAILAANGKQSVSLDTLMADYSEYSIAVDQEKNGDLSFRIVEATDESR